MENYKMIAGFSGIIGAFFTIYIVFVTPSGIGLWYPVIATQLLLVSGALLLISERHKTPYASMSAYLISLLLVLSHMRRIYRIEYQARDYISSYVEFFSIGMILFGFIVSVILIFHRDFQKN